MEWAVCLTETEWAWQDDTNVIAVLAHLLERAATATRRYGYETLARGDAFTTHAFLSESCGLTIKQVRLALVKLKKAEELEPLRRPKGLLIRLLRYDDWLVRYRNPRKTAAGPSQRTRRALQRRLISTQTPQEGQKNDGEKTVHGQSHEEVITTKLQSFYPPTPPASGTSRSITTSPTAQTNPDSSSQKLNSYLRQEKNPFVRERLGKLIHSERLPLSSGVLDDLADAPLEHIGLVIETATERRDQKSNVAIPHAVGLYRASKGVTPRKETIDRLRRVLTPLAEKPVLPPQPRWGCPYCFGSGFLYGERCACVGGARRTSIEIEQLREERDKVMRRISEQIGMYSAPLTNFYQQGKADDGSNAAGAGSGSRRDHGNGSDYAERRPPTGLAEKQTDPAGS